VQAILPEVGESKLISQLELVKQRSSGKIFKLKDGSELQLNLVKNPASRQGLASYVRPVPPYGG